MSLQELRNKIFNKQSEVTPLFYLAKELGCLSDIIGREYEVRDSKGKLVFTIKQKPMNLPQLRILNTELINHYKREEKQSRRGMKKK